MDTGKTHEVPSLTLLQAELLDRGYSPVRRTGDLHEVEMLSPAGFLVRVDEMGCIIS